MNDEGPIGTKDYHGWDGDISRREASCCSHVSYAFRLADAPACLLGLSVLLRVFANILGKPRRQFGLPLKWNAQLQGDRIAIIHPHHLGPHSLQRGRIALATPN